MKFIDEYWKFILAITIILAIIIFIPSRLWYIDYHGGSSAKIDSNILSQYGSFISAIVAVIGLIINLVLVKIAYDGFRNYDVKKQVLAAQWKLVVNLIDKLNNNTYSLFNGSETEFSFFDIDKNFFKPNKARMLLLLDAKLNREVGDGHLLYDHKEVKLGNLLAFLLNDDIKLNPLFPEKIHSQLKKIKEVKITQHKNDFHKFVPYDGRVDPLMFFIKKVAKIEEIEKCLLRPYKPIKFISEDEYLHGYGAGPVMELHYGINKKELNKRLKESSFIYRMTKTTSAKTIYDEFLVYDFRYKDKVLTSEEITNCLNEFVNSITTWLKSYNLSDGTINLEKKL